MSKYRKHITEFDCCPHCGSEDGFIQHFYVCEKRIAKVDDNLNYLIGENGWVRDLEERIKQLDYED